jgi:hypothetical protein
MGVALLEMMEQNSHHITDLDLRFNETIGNEGSKSPSQVLGKKRATKPQTPLFECHIGDEGCIELVSALEQNTSLLQLDLRNNTSERVILALESLPEIKVLQRVDFSWCPALVSAMPYCWKDYARTKVCFVFVSLIVHLLRYHQQTKETAKCTGAWMHQMERVPKPLSPYDTCAEREVLPGVWYRALALAATFLMSFEVLRSKPNLVPSEPQMARSS